MKEKKSWQRNTGGLKQHAINRSQEATKKVDHAIAILIQNNQAINFNSVSSIANVTKAYLYSNLQIRERIELLRNQQKLKTKPKTASLKVTDKSKNLILAAKDRRIKELELENRRLKEELKIALGKLYEHF